MRTMRTTTRPVAPCAISDPTKHATFLHGRGNWPPVVIFRDILRGERLGRGKAHCRSLRDDYDRARPRPTHLRSTLDHDAACPRSIGQS